MREQIEKIVKQLCKHNINKEEAVNKLLNLHIDIGCINEHYESAEIKCGTTNKTLFFAPYGLRGVRIK